jgi:hypothetical protein
MGNLDVSGRIRQATAEVCAGTVLSGGNGTKYQTAGSLPQSSPETERGYDLAFPRLEFLTAMLTPTNLASEKPFFNTHRWDEKAGLRRDAVRSQVIDVLEAQEIKETGNEKG